MFLSLHLTTVTLPTSEMCLFTNITRRTSETLSLLARSNESKGKTATHKIPPAEEGHSRVIRLQL